MKPSAVIAIFSAFCLLSSAALAEDHTQDESGSGSGSFSSFTNLFSSGTKTRITSGKGTANINEVQSEAYDGPKARIAIARFTDKTRSGWYSGRIGSGMADQMATALVNTSRYIVLERAMLGDVLKEQNLGASGRVRRSTAAAIGQIEGAELLITGAVTEFQRGVSGRGGRISGGGLLGNIGSAFGALAGSTKRSHIAIDVRIIDTRTSRIVAATSVEGKATDVNFGGAASRYFGGGRLGGSLSGWDREPIGKALRTAINHAVAFVVSKTPPIYYRHGKKQLSRAKPSRAKPSRAKPSRSKPSRAKQASSKGSAAQRLKRLKSLRDQGLITAGEYKAKRKEILSKL